jgi:2-oxoglutarate ferredoxin oxidoreductase subunit delta
VIYVRFISGERALEVKQMAGDKKISIMINNAWCKGCGLCVGVCPKHVLELSDRFKSTPVRENDCIGCLQCENICPDLAVNVVKEVV